MAETDSGTLEPERSRRGTEAERDGTKEGKTAGKEEKKRTKKKGNGKKSEGEKKKESGKKENKSDDDKKKEGNEDNGNKGRSNEDEGKKNEAKTEIVKASNGMKDERNERKNSDPKLDALMKVWMEFQATSRDSSMKIERLESTLKTLETSLDRFGKFCGEYQLIWRVKGFSQRFDEARNGQRPIIYSPTFDTHRSGYKLQLSLCPNGDGKGQGVSLSLFFAILKGPYDSLLQWPFVCPVTMTLLEQVSDLSIRQPRDVTMTFVPNPRPDNEPFLGKPDEAKNLSLGFQKFILLTDLFDGEYIQDDSIFIKVYVDISNVMAL